VTIHFSNFPQQVAYGIRTHSNDQQVSLLRRSMQIRFWLDPVLPFEVSQLLRMPVMNNNGLIIFR
jgi:hypothetical protein